LLPKNEVYYVPVMAEMPEMHYGLDPDMVCWHNYGNS